MRQYETFELSFDGATLNDQWASVDVTAVFTDQSGSKTVKGFYAGDGVYKVRYMPETVGEVSWKVSGVVSGEGKEICEPAAEDRHGIVRANGVHLMNADGSWFFSFGTTVYGLAHQDKEITEQTFDTLSKNPFNKVRMCVFPKHYDYNVNDPEYFPFEVNAGMTYTYDRGNTFNDSPFLSEKAKYWNVNQPCFAFWDAFEEKIKRLDDMGIQVDLILFHPYDRWGFSYLSAEQNRIYLEYLISRLAAFPNIWWSLANEYDICADKSQEDWYQIEECVAANDPYHHLLSNHNCFDIWDFSRENITHCSLQKRTMTLVPEMMEKYHKPVLYDECVYEGNVKQTWGSLNGEEMTNRFWKVTVHGGYCTHGEVYLDMDMENIDDAVLWWAKGGKLIGTSPARIAYLRNLMEEIGQPLVPYEGPMAFVFKPDLPKEVEDNLPDSLKSMRRSIKRMDKVDLVRHHDQETFFAGHAGEDTYLFYYGTDCCARVDINLPKDHTYKIEVIDAWNMTRETFTTGASGDLEVKLTGRPYMAVLATRES
ncbi:MAG: DUF4038 domain-containing protein [Lachnospiraceae bacterium]|nr:DUF4038 domain-containing protein [Lachnospiraceae bacterium]